MSLATDQFGPIYPDLGIKVAKLRHGNCRKAHGAAVLSAILARQKAACTRSVVPQSRPNCASRTFHQDGATILEAVAEQNKARVNAKSYFRPDGSISAARSAAEWQELYDAAMAQKNQETRK